MKHILERFLVRGVGLAMLSPLARFLSLMLTPFELQRVGGVTRRGGTVQRASQHFADY